MRSLFLLLLGACAGAIATVLALALDTPFEDGNAPATNVGNARIGLDEDALQNVVNQQVVLLPLLGQTPVTEVQVLDDGMLEVTLGPAPGSELASASVLLDPEVVDGKLVVAVVESDAVGLAAPEEVGPVLQAALELRLVALAGDEDYELVAIITKDGRLTLEIQT